MEMNQYWQYVLVAALQTDGVPLNQSNVTRHMLCTAHTTHRVGAETFSSCCLRRQISAGHIDATRKLI